MQQLSNIYGRRLKEIAQVLNKNLRLKYIYFNVKENKKIEYYPTNTFGWYLQLFQISNADFRYSLELWLDCFTNSKRPKISIVLSSKDINTLNILSATLNLKYSLSDTHIVHQECTVLIEPLKKKYFECFLFEQFHDEKFCYLSYYLREDIHSSTLQKKQILDKIQTSIEYILSSISEAIALKFTIDQTYSSIENRLKVYNHLKRERSSKLAQIVKSRDNYKCFVCEKSMNELYGELGNKYAEAHHLEPLKSSNSTRMSFLNDIITVCPNCHSILHRMEGKPDDHLELRSIVKKNSTLK